MNKICTNEEHQNVHCTMHIAHRNALQFIFYETFKTGKYFAVDVGRCPEDKTMTNDMRNCLWLLRQPQKNISYIHMETFVRKKNMK